METTGGNVLELKGISKSFFGTQVLKDVNLSVRPGEIHALVGENGAGKTTLMNILFGMQVISDTGGFEGQIVLDGKPATIDSPGEAMARGIGMVHQEFMLIPGFTVGENIKLNREPTRSNFASRVFGSKLETVDGDIMRADSRAALDKLAISIDEWALVAGLPVGHMQFILLFPDRV
ncbi:MAG: ATP-binding cassette domain-containing protein [Firmicutes bacterium]|nr:ATP-binding cassette domain-containing protein [Bacillota bacterium]